MVRELQIDYQNLFVSCIGGEGNKKGKQFCDSFKGEQELKSINLLTNIEGIQIFYIIGLLIFIVLFVVIFIRTMRLPNNEMEEIKSSILKDGESKDIMTSN